MVPAPSVVNHVRRRGTSAKNAVISRNDPASSAIRSAVASRYGVCRSVAVSAQYSSLVDTYGRTTYAPAYATTSTTTASTRTHVRASAAKCSRRSSMPATKNGSIISVRVIANVPGNVLRFAARQTATAIANGHRTFRQIGLVSRQMNSVARNQFSHTGSSSDQSTWPPSVYFFSAV